LITPLADRGDLQKNELQRSRTILLIVLLWLVTEMGIAKAGHRGTDADVHAQRAWANRTFVAKPPVPRSLAYSLTQ